MDTLEAVKEIISRSGRRPPSSLDTAGASPASDAEKMLDEADISVQSRGWHFNTKVNIELEPDESSSQIELPAPVFTIDSYGISAGRNVSAQGRILYDHDNNTTTFTENLFVRYIERHDFDCLPHPVQKYIVLKAAAEFNARYGTAKGRDRDRLQRSIERDLQRAEAEAFRFNSDTANVNVLDTAQAHNARGNRYPHQRGR
jgi:hypothetical protein